MARFQVGDSVYLDKKKGKVTEIVESINGESRVYKVVFEDREFVFAHSSMLVSAFDYEFELGVGQGIEDWQNEQALKSWLNGDK